jgi:hypothetical protein
VCPILWSLSVTADPVGVGGARILLWDVGIGREVRVVSKSVGLHWRFPRTVGHAAASRIDGGIRSVTVVAQLAIIISCWVMKDSTSAWIRPLLLQLGVMVAFHGTGCVPLGILRDPAQSMLLLTFFSPTNNA